MPRHTTTLHLVAGGTTALVVGLLVSVVGRQASPGLGSLRPVAAVGGPLAAFAGASVAASQTALWWRVRHRAHDVDAAADTVPGRLSPLRRARWAVLAAALLTLGSTGFSLGGVRHVEPPYLAIPGLLVTAWLVVEVAIGARGRLRGDLSTGGPPADGLLSTEHRAILAGLVGVALCGAVAVALRDHGEPIVAAGIVLGVGIALPQAYLAVRDATDVPTRLHARVAVAAVVLVLLVGEPADGLLAGGVAAAWLAAEALLGSRSARGTASS